MEDFQQEGQLVEVDRLAFAVQALRLNPAITDEEMAEVLGLCPASAGFWRLRAFYVVNGFYPSPFEFLSKDC